MSRTFAWMRRLRNQFQILKCFALLTTRDRRKINLILAAQIAMSVLDLIGIALIGVLGALAVTGVQSSSTSVRIQGILNNLHIENFDFRIQIAILGVSAVVLFIVRTIFSVLMSRKILLFLSIKSAIVSSNATREFIEQPYDRINSESTQGILYKLTIGIDAVFVFVIGTSLSLIADLSLLIIMFAGMLAVDPTMAISSLVFFGLVGFLLYKILNRRASLLGNNYSKLQIESNEMLREVLFSYREILVRNRQTYYVEKFASNRMEFAINSANMAFLPNVSKYALEGSVLLGAFFITSIQFLIHDAPKAVAVLAVFMAAGTRIAPAVLRVQQGALLIKSTLSQTRPTLELLSGLKVSSNLDQRSNSSFSREHAGFIPKVEIVNLTKIYPGASHCAVENFDLTLNPGEFVAIVGPSGSGKSTILDCLLGITEPTQGLIQISGMSPKAALSSWPGAIGYVSQDVYISNSGILENIALGFDSSEIPSSSINSALKSSKLSDFIEQLPEGLDTILGENGARISGGQRQRVGIARALVTSPKLLVLDEATSALDGLSESQISSEILSLKGEISILVIAHRLSTILQADRIYFIENGRLLGHGNFDQLKKMVPQFAEQAKIMGL